jgi:hypothetical protein
MKSSTTLSLFALLFTGCLDVAPGPEGDVVDEAPRLGANAMLPGQIQATQLNKAAITGTSINSVAQTSDGRAFLGYLIGCALDSSQSISTTVGGFNYTFPGVLGVETAWTSRALTTSESRWVSACVLARVNLTGTSVTISMRGSNSALYTDSNDAPYLTQEGAFFGNIFLSGTPKFGCNGTDQYNHDGYGDLALRECANTDPNNVGKTKCGFTDRLQCTNVCTSGSYYTGCSDGSGNTYNEVVTTWVYGSPQ